ncbi:gamma carbonic anhydrase family protein [bacterium]|nr:gamma carbonic anhydrase family protein [bacterium]
MALILPVRGKHPEIDPSCWLAPNATVVGEVRMGPGGSIWFNAVVRGDVHFIEIGHSVNIQDQAVIHCTYQKAPTRIGNEVSIGHSAIVHGCTLHDRVLVGMGAIVMDGCEVHSGSLIAAGAVITQNTVVPAGTLWAGVPARQIKEVDPALFEGEVMRIARNYALYSDWFRNPEAHQD